MNVADDAVVDRLSAKERASLDQFRISTADLSLPSREDWYLLKWLRARKFDTNDARKMLIEHIAWRKKHEVDTILEDYQAPTVLLKYFPGGLLDCSPDRRPVLIAPAGQADFKGMLEAASRTDLLRHCIYLLETQEELKRQLTLQTGGRRIETMHVVTDMEGFSFWQLSSLEVVSALTEVVQMYEANYPEILEEAFIVNGGKRVCHSYTFASWVRPLFVDRECEVRKQQHLENGQRHSLNNNKSFTHKGRTRGH